MQPYPQASPPKPYRSRLEELSRPERTSVRNSLSQNCVPAWMLRRRNLQSLAGSDSVCMPGHHQYITCDAFSVQRQCGSILYSAALKPLGKCTLAATLGASGRSTSGR